MVRIVSKIVRKSLVADQGSGKAEEQQGKISRLSAPGMPFNFDFAAALPSLPPPRRRKEEKSHAGEWRDCNAASRQYYCALEGTESEDDGSHLCCHGDVISASHWSCCGSLNKNSNLCSVEAVGVLRCHTFITGTCKICWRCASCTGYGKRCCRVVDEDRSVDRGGKCGCGDGDTGCSTCGLCLDCAKQLSPSPSASCKDDGSDIPCPGPLNLPAGTRVWSEWRRGGGNVYAGVIQAARPNPSSSSSASVYEVAYDDGDIDLDVQPSRVHLTAPEGSAREMSQSLGRLVATLCGEAGLRDTALPLLLAQAQAQARSVLTGERREDRPGSSSEAETETNSAEGALARVLGLHARLPPSSSSSPAHATQTPASPRAAHASSAARVPSSFSFSSSSSSLSSPSVKAKRPSLPAHAGLLQCGCLHSIGLSPWPLDSSHIHLAHRCLWSCCGEAWNSARPCPELGPSEEALLESRASRQGHTGGGVSVGVGDSDWVEASSSSSFSSSSSSSSSWTPREPSSYEVMSPEQLMEVMARQVLVPFGMFPDDKLSRKRALFCDY